MAPGIKHPLVEREQLRAYQVTLQCHKHYGEEDDTKQNPSPRTVSARPAPSLYIRAQGEQKINRRKASGRPVLRGQQRGQRCHHRDTRTSASSRRAALALTPETTCAAAARRGRGYERRADRPPVPLVPKPGQRFKLQGAVSSLNQLLRWKAAKAFAILFSFQINCAKS